MKIIPQLLLATLVLTVFLCACGQQKDTVATPTAIPAAKVSALDTLKKAASAGDTKAQLELAKRFDKGDGVGKNLTTAFEWYQKAAEGGNADAMLATADCFFDGRGVQQDMQRGKHWLIKAADAGNPEAQYRHARTFGRTEQSTFIMGEKNDRKNQQENAKRYLEWIDKATKQNYPAAQYALGMTYLRGAVGIAEFFLINYFGEGDSLEDVIGKRRKLIEPEPDKGVPLLKQSADAGYWQAQWALAVLYQTGLGKIKSDKDLSQKYWKLLADQANPDVQYQIGGLYHSTNVRNYKVGKNKYQGRDLAFDETNKVAMEWFQKAADKNNKDALYDLGKMYRDELGILNDNHKAMELIKRAAELGHGEAIQVLAFALLGGNGVAKDYTEAQKWLLKAADQDPGVIMAKDSGVHKARNALGAFYEFGLGVNKDLVLAYAWYNVAASGGSQKAEQNLARVERNLNPDELAEAQTLSRKWQPGKPMVRANAANQLPLAVGTSAAVGSPLKYVSMGTGFYISPNGNAVTNSHVISGCKEIRIPVENTVAKLVVADQANDLALIKLDVTGKHSLAFPDTDTLKQGEDIFVFGFPLDGYLPSTGNITPGIISALAGPGNNSSLLQITAPVQQGNSGGPLLNKKGKAVGVVVGKVDAIKVAKFTGDIPQNINFAIAARTVKSFLDANRIDYKKSGDFFAFDKDAVGIADEARKVSLKIECWK